MVWADWTTVDKFAQGDANGYYSSPYAAYPLNANNEQAYLEQQCTAMPGANVSKVYIQLRYKNGATNLHYPYLLMGAKIASDLNWGNLGLRWNLNNYGPTGLTIGDGGSHAADIDTALTVTTDGAWHKYELKFWKHSATEWKLKTYKDDVLTDDLSQAWSYGLGTGTFYGICYATGAGALPAVAFDDLKMGWE